MATMKVAVNSPSNAAALGAQAFRAKMSKEANNPKETKVEDSNAEHEA